MMLRVKPSGHGLATVAGVAAVALLAAASLSPARASGSTTASLGVSLNITTACTVSANPVNFGSQPSVFTSALYATGTVYVTCPNATPYTVALDKGIGSGANTTTRVLTGTGGATVNYSLYQDPGHTNLWGDTAGSNTVAGNGTGFGQGINVYGMLPAPPTALTGGTYSDTVTVTVTY